MENYCIRKCNLNALKWFRSVIKQKKKLDFVATKTSLDNALSEIRVDKNGEIRCETVTFEGESHQYEIVNFLLLILAFVKSSLNTAIDIASFTNKI